MKESFYVKMAKRYADDPVGWINEFISFRGLEHKGLTDQQKEIAESLVKYKFLCIAAGGGIGKSALVAMLIIWFLATHPGARVPTTAPNSAQLHDTLFAEISKWLDRCKIKSMFNLTKGRLNVIGQRDWYCVARTVRRDIGNLNGTLAGFHSGHILIAVDEAADVPDPVFTALDGALTGKNSYIILISNPISYGGYFFDTVEDPEGTGFKVHQYSSIDSPLVTPDYARRIAARYGEDSAMYKTKVLGQTVTAANFAVVAPKDYENIIMSQREIKSGNNVVGIDVGGSGAGLTVLCHRSGYSIRRWDTLSGKADELLVQTGEIIRSMYGETHVTLVPDSIGEGSGYTSLLPQYVPRTATVVPYDGRLKASDEQMYPNTRSEVYDMVRRTFSKLHFPINPPKRLKKELANLMFLPHSELIELEPKKNFVRRLGFSPDYADALANALFVKITSKDVPIKMGKRTSSFLEALCMPDDTIRHGKYGMFV
jgi:phage terminase large subunit